MRTTVRRYGSRWRRTPLCAHCDGSGRDSVCSPLGIIPLTLCVSCHPSSSHHSHPRSRCPRSPPRLHPRPQADHPMGAAGPGLQRRKSMGCHGNCLMLPRTQSSPIHLHTQTRDLKQEAPSLLSVCVPPPPCPQSPSPLAHRHGASRQAIPSLSAHLRRWLAWYRVSAMPWRVRRAPGGGGWAVHMSYVC